jgi:hypothetical protein
VPTLSGSTVRYDSGSGQYFATRLSFDDVDPAFTPTLSYASGGTSPVIIGTTITPTLNGNPQPNGAGVTVYNVSDNQGGGPTSRLGSSGGFQGPSTTYSLIAPGTVSFSASVTKNGVNKTANSPAVTFASQFWTGVGTPGATGLNGATGALVGATGTLAAVLATNPVNVNFSPSPSAQKVYAVCETSGGSHQCHDNNGDLVPMTATHIGITVSINGHNRTMDLYESDNLLTTLANPLHFFV